MEKPFAPSWKWHAKVIAVILLLCTAAFFMISYMVQQLPPPYKRNIPPAETTPWLK